MALKLSKDARNFLQNRLKENGFVEKNNIGQNKAVTENRPQKKTTAPYDTRPALPQVKSAVGDVKKFVQNTDIKKDNNTLKSGSVPIKNTSGNLTTKTRDMSKDTLTSGSEFAENKRNNDIAKFFDAFENTPKKVGKSLAYLGENVLLHLDNAAKGTANIIDSGFNFLQKAELNYFKDLANEQLKHKGKVSETVQKVINQNEYHIDLNNERIKNSVSDNQAELNKLNLKYNDVPENVRNAFNFVGEAAEMTPNVLLSALNPALGTAYIAASAYSNSYGEALNDGATTQEASNYALASAALEVALEKLGGNKLFGGKTLTDSLTDKFVKRVAKNKLAQKTIRFIAESSEEGIEEVLSTALQPLIKKFAYSGTYDAPDFDEYVNSFFGGMIGSAVWSGAAAATNKISDLSRKPTTEVHIPAKQNMDIKTPPSTEIAKNGPVKTTDVNSAIERILNGTATNKDIDLFKPANAQNRAMFEEATGVKLPSTNSEVRHYLRDYGTQKKSTLSKKDIEGADKLSDIEFDTITKEAYDVQKKAETVQQTLNGIMGNVVDKHGLVKHFGGTKSVKSMVEKVIRKRYNEGVEYDLMTMKDHARGTININDYNEASKVVGDLMSQIPNAQLEIKNNMGGYFGIHITGQISGMNVEVQVHTEEGSRIKEISDEIYHKWRNVDENSLTDAQKAERDNDYEKTAKLYSDYFAELGINPAEISSSIENTLLLSNTVPKTPSNGFQEPSFSSRTPLGNLEPSNSRFLSSERYNDSSGTSRPPKDTNVDITTPPNNIVQENIGIVNNQYMQNVENNVVQNDVPGFEDFKETVLERYPNMPEDNIREAYNKFYGLTDETGNDIINNNEVYYQRSGKDAEQQGRDNGNGKEQSGSDFEGADTIRTEGYKFRNGRDYKVCRTGLWQKAYGRVSGTLKKTTPKYIRHGNRAIMFSEYDNAKSVKQFFKDVYNRDVIICKDDIVDKNFGVKGMPEFNAVAAYVQGSILVSMGRNSETSLVHEMIHEGQNDVEYENAVDSIKRMMDINALDNHILEKESDYGNTYENRVNFDDDILYETYADIISRLATKEWREYGSRSELFADEASYNKAKEIAEDYVVHLINNPPQKKIDTIIKDFSEFEKDFADNYMFEKSDSDSSLYFALKQSEANDALAFMEKNYGEMYRNLIKEHGAIKPGESPRIDVEVPRKSSKNQYVSNFARTFAESGIMPSEMQGDFEKMVVDGTMSHEVFTNKKAENGANQRINRDGFKESVKEFETLVNAGRVNKEDIAMGQMLLNIACQNKDVELAKKLAVDLSVAATQFGQNVQAFSMLKRMSPDGQLYYLEKSIERINQEILEKYKGEFKEIEIDSELAKNLLNAKSEKEINEAVYVIEKNIGEQIPATKMDKWNAWRYLAMLGNTRTHFRNVFGNAVFAPARGIKNVIGAGFEKALPKAERTKSLTKTKESKDFAENDWKLMADVVKGNEGKYGTRRGIEEHRKIFKTKWLEVARKFNTNALEIEDGWFLESAYKSAFAQAMTARGLGAEYLNSGTKQANEDLQRLREYAINEAQRATYRDSNAFSEMVKNIRFRKTDAISQKAADIGNVFVEGVLPFKKTPANILARGVEYSPVGLMKGISDLYQVKKGNMSAAKAIDNISAGLTGTAIVGLGAFLAHLGALVVSPDEDDEVSGYKKMLGAQNYALKIGDHTYTIDWMSPTAMPLFVGAEIIGAFKNTENFNFKTVTDALTRISEPAFELSCLSGIQSALDSIKYADGSIVDDLLVDMALSYATQALPTLGGQIARTVDNTQRNSYYKDKNSKLPEAIEGLINKAASKIPGATFLLPEKIDRWGRVQKYGSLPERVLENFVSPGYYSNNKSTFTDKKLMDLYEKTGDKSVLPDVATKSFKVDGDMKYMSADEYVEYSKERGSLSYEYITSFLNELGTNTLDDSLKVEVVNGLYKYANAKAKEKVSDYVLDKQYAKVDEAKKAGIAPDKYFVAYYCSKGKESDKTASGKTIPNSATRKEFKEIKKNVTGLSEAQKTKLLKIMGYSDKQIKMFKYDLPN